MMKRTFFSLLCCFLASCTGIRAEGPFAAGVEAHSFAGEDLLRPTFSQEVETALLANLTSAEREHALHPEDEMAAIWHGRRLGYLGRYREAVNVYSAALKHHPESFRLLRHRGHRNISLRRIQEAVRDLRQASELSRDYPDRYEPDGAPNPLGIPRSTTRSNIEYHLGLALYLAHDFKQSLAAWNRCLFLSQVNDDMLVATTYWYVLTLWRLERWDQVAAKLEPIQLDMDVIENHDYHKLLLFYKGLVSESDIIVELWRDGLNSAALGFGVGAWNLAKGRKREAHALFMATTENTAWAAFGHIASEGELAR